MVDKTTTNERVYTIPLRQAWKKTPRDRRVLRSINVVKEFLSRHTKSEDIRISESLNRALWNHGSHKPPGSIKVKISQEKDFVKAMLTTETVKQLKKEEKGGLVKVLKGKGAGKKEEPKLEAVAETKTEAKAEKPALTEANIEAKEEAKPETKEEATPKVEAKDQPPEHKTKESAGKTD